MKLAAVRVSVEREKVRKHIERVTAERVPEVSSVRLFVGLKVALEMPFMLGVCRLAENIKVSEHVLEIKAERLTELITPGSSRALSGEPAAPHLIILPPPLCVGQRLVS